MVPDTVMKNEPGSYSTEMPLFDREEVSCYSLSAGRFGVMLWKMCNVLLFKGVIAAP
jgi:hypothetical protein